MRLSVAVAVACFSLTALSTAAEVEAAIRKSISIPAQGLGPALQTLAQERAFQVVYLSDAVDRLRTSGAVGEFTTEEALTRLLNDTGLGYRYIDERTITVFPISTGSNGPSPRANKRAGGEDSALPLQGGGKKEGKNSEGEEDGRTFWSRFRLAQAELGQRPSDGSTEESRIATEGRPTRIEEVVVTAQKREERLRDVPISITVLGGKQLDRSTAEGVTETLNRIPGVSASVGYAAAGTLVTVRGVNGGAALFNGSSPVGYYLDAVPFGLVKSAIAPDASVFDLERIEVLRGPQGTLYGASAQNGVVRVLTKDADSRQFDLKARTSMSATENGGENYRGDMAINLPIVEGKLAARAVVSYQDLGGWIDKPNDENADDARIGTIRLKVNGQPTEQLSIGLSAWRSRSDYGMPPISADGETSPFLTEEPVAADYDVYGFQLGYVFGAFNLSSVTSYLDYANDSSTEYFGALTNGAVLQALRTTLDSQVFTQEVTLNSRHAGPWRWSVGGIYRDGQDRLYQFRSGYLAPTILNDFTKSYAAFGQLTRLFFDSRLELTGGLRYFHDEVTNREDSRTSAVPASQLFTHTNNFEKVSPRLALAWHPGEQSTIYVSYSEGFRSGFPQNGAVFASAPQFPPLKADNLKNYEIGAKGSLFGARLNFDAAAYYIDWQDIQQTLVVNAGTVANPVNVSALVNGEAASGLGFEAALWAEPLKGLALSANFSWNDLTQDGDVVSSGLVLIPKGSRLQNSPEYTAGASADYTFPLGGNGIESQLSASVNYISEQQQRAVFGGVRVATGDEILISRASFAIRLPEHWSATFFVDNLSDEQGVVTRSPFSADWNSRLRPRTAGVQLEYRFAR